MAETTLHNLNSTHWQIGILPATGASIAFGRIQHKQQWFNFFRPTAEADYGNPSNCASFPLIPYSNRIRDRRFRFHGETFELRPGKPDGTVMHGVGRDLPWRVENMDSHYISLALHSSDYPDLNFPFRFSARLEYRVEGAKFSIGTRITNDDLRIIPAGFGHHPYFQRTLTNENDEIGLAIPCDEYFELDQASLPIGSPHPIPPRLDFRNLRPLGELTPNDNLTTRKPDEPVQFVYMESGQQILMTADPVFANLILYAPAGKPFYAVEPVTNANDGFNLYANGVRNSGVFELEPGQSKSGTITFEVI